MKRFINLLTGSPDRLLTLISLLLGVFSLAFTVYVYAIPTPIPQYISARDAIIVVSLVLIIMNLSVRYYKKEDLSGRFRDLLDEQLAINHQLLHKFRDDFFWNIRNELVGENLIQADNINEVKREYFNNVCHSILGDTRVLFLEYFSARGFNIGDDLSLTLEIIIEAEDAQQILYRLKGERAERLSSAQRYIVTGYRDPVTWEKKPERNEFIKSVFQITEENTIFDEILNNGKSYFINNDLKKTDMEGKYRNQNPNWNKLYNSVLAVPILYQRHGNRETTIQYGILSVDSVNFRRHELFDDKTTLHMLSSSADMLALMFGHLDIVQIAEKLAKYGNLVRSADPKREITQTPKIIKEDQKDTENSSKATGQKNLAKQVLHKKASKLKSDKKLKVFLCHSSNDKSFVRELYKLLSAENWIDPWLDEERLLPGQDWDLEVDKAVETSDAVIVCLSKNSVSKEGYIQRELKYVLDSALEKPEDTIFIIPLRLDNVEPPRRLRSLQYVDYFPETSRESSFKRLCNSLKLRFEKINQ